MYKPSLLTLIVFLTLGFSGQLLAQEAALTGDITVIAVGLESGQGTVKMALSNSAQDYQGREGDPPFRAASVAVNDKQATHTFSGLPYGDYALKLFHDTNGNDMLDTNFMGIPNEPYAFSNNAQARFGPPAYEKAKFSVNSSHTALRIDFR